jgi:hypothetical protein
LTKISDGIARKKKPSLQKTNAMTKQLLILIFITLIAFKGTSQLNNLWRANTEMATYDRQRVYEAPSGNVVLARMDDYYGIGDGNDLLKCYSPDGALLWAFGEEDFTDNSGSNFIDIEIDNDGNTYIVGSNFPQSAFYPKSEVIKISPSGEELWRINFTQQTTWSEEVSEIEITSDGRIFLIAQLFNSDAETIIPHFVEIDADGQTLQLIPDNNFLFGYANLFEHGDGFLYATEGEHLVKLNYDGSVVWSVEFDFGDNTQSYFGYEGAEYTVDFYNTKTYVCQKVLDLNTNESHFGIAIFTENGSVTYHNYTILPELPELSAVNPLFFDIDASGNMFVVGDYIYGESGPTVAENSNDDRGGKTSTYRGAFVTRIDNTNSQNWTLAFPETDTSNDKYPVGTFLHEDRIAVVYIHALDGNAAQLVECYDSNTSAVAWSHIDATNEMYALSNPQGSYLDEDGDLYTFGSGGIEGEFGFDFSIYLYKYDILASGIAEKTNSIQVNVWPNPANNVLNLSSTEQMSMITVYNCLGQKCYEEMINSGFASVNISSLATGVYVAQIQGNTMSTIEFVKE